jgi:hypothetical protein
VAPDGEIVRLDEAKVAHVYRIRVDVGQ